MATIVESQIETAGKKWLDAFQRGPTRTRWTKLPLQVNSHAPDMQLRDVAGESVHLREFWQERPALLLFWRHYGCSCGMERAQRLHNEYADYRQAGANVVVIGQGEPERSAEYARKRNIPCPVLCDPTYHVYEAYDLLEGFPSQVFFDESDELQRCDLEAGRKLWESRLGTERALVDSPWQLPGEFVVDQRGIIRLAYRYNYCEDWPNPLVLRAAIKEARWGLLTVV
jgi:peroxiredoxin